MNKILATALSTVILAAGAGVTHATMNHQQEVPTNVEVQASEAAYQLQLSEKALQQLPEYSTIAAHASIAEMSAQIVEDSNAKRVIVFSNTTQKEQLKSIFLKHNNIVKVIDYKAGLIYNGALTQTTVQQQPAQPSKFTVKNNFPEQQTIAAYVNVEQYTAQVVEDNANKRIIVFTNQAGQEQFTSIFVKRTNQLKIVNYREGLIYNGIIR